MLTERVSYACLTGPRKDGVSYIFAGEPEVDLDLALDILNRELGIKRLLLEGGGNASGSLLLRAALVDEISLTIYPAMDGTRGARCVCDSRDKEAGMPAPHAR